MKNKIILMKEALTEANKALVANEIPIGAIVTKDGEIIGRGYNKRETENDITGHAEIEAINQAAQVLNTWKLTGCELYVTVEPCLMCYGAILSSRIDKVYASLKQYDFKKNSFRFYLKDELIDKTNIEYGLLEKESQKLLTNFFNNLRTKKGQ